MDRRPLNLEELGAAQLSLARSIVKDERERRGWSLDQAAVAAGADLRAQTWLNFENGKTRRLTGKMYVAVKTAYGWPDDWPINPPELRAVVPEHLIEVQLDAILSKLDEEPTRQAIDHKLDQLIAAVADLSDSLGVRPRRQHA